MIWARRLRPRGFLGSVAQEMDGGECVGGKAGFRKREAERNNEKERRETESRRGV